MVFENQNLEKLAHNFVDVKKDRTGFIYFKRFTNEQFETLAKNPLFQMMGQSTAGIFLFFKTNGNEISFQCKKESILTNVIPILRYGGAKIIEAAKTSMSLEKKHGGRLKMNDAFDIYINGERVTSPKPRSVSCPPKTGPKSMLVLGQSGGRNNGKTEGIFSRTDHHETARSRSAAWAR